MVKFFDWLEANTSRTRKLVLLSTIFIYLLIVLILFTGSVIWALPITEQVVTLFMIFTGLVGSVYGFFTGTSSKKSAELSDKAAEMMMKKINEMEKN